MNNGAIQYEPKATDIIDNEAYPKRTLRIQNGLSITISIGQLASDWHSVNFILAHQKYESKYTKWIATLEPTDTVEFVFNESKQIDK